MQQFQRTAYDIAFLSSHFEVSFFLRNLMEKQGGPIVLPNPLTVSRDNTYSPFDHIDAMVSMMGRKGQNYSSTSLLPYAKLSSRSASHLRSSFRENKAKKIAKSFHHDSAGPYPVPRKFINFDRVDHGPSPLAQECPTSPMRSAPAHVVPSRNPLHDTIDTILTGSHDCDPFSDSFEEAGGPPAELSGSLSGNLVGLMVEEEDDEEDLCYDETGSKDPPKQPKDEPDLKPLSKEREESESIRPLVYLSKIGVSLLLLVLLVLLLVVLLLVLLLLFSPSPSPSPFPSLLFSAHIFLYIERWLMDCGSWFPVAWSIETRP